MKMIVIGAAVVCAVLTMNCSDSIGTISPVIESSTTVTGVISLRDSLIQKPRDAKNYSFGDLRVSSQQKQSSSILISSATLSSSSHKNSSIGGQIISSSDTISAGSSEQMSSIATQSSVVASSNAFVSSSLTPISSVGESSVDVIASSMSESSSAVIVSSAGSSSSIDPLTLIVSSSSLGQVSSVFSSSSNFYSSAIISSSSVTPVVLLINEFDYDAYKDSELDQQTTVSTATSPEIYYRYWASMGHTGDKVNLRKDAKDSVAYIKMATPDLTGMTRIIITCKRTATTVNEWFLALRYEENGHDYWTPSAEFGSKISIDTTGVEVDVSMTAAEFGLLNFNAVNKLNLIGRADNSTVSIQMNTVSADNR